MNSAHAINLRESILNSDLQTSLPCHSFFSTFKSWSPPATVDPLSRSLENMIWKDSDLWPKNDCGQQICHPIYGLLSDAQLFWCGMLFSQ